MAELGVAGEDGEGGVEEESFLWRFFGEVASGDSRDDRLVS